MAPNGSPWHKCSAPWSPELDEDAEYEFEWESRDNYGHAVFYCIGRDDGTLWVDNGEYANIVNYCPFCGQPATKRIEDLGR